MCFALSLDGPNQTDDLETADTANVTMYQCILRGKGTSQPSLSMTGESLKRQSSATLPDEPSFKKARTSITVGKDIQVVAVEDSISEGCSQIEGTSSDHLPRFENEGEPLTRDDTEGADHVHLDETIRGLKVKANNIIRNKKQLIAGLEKELKHMESDRDAWQDKAIESQITEKVFRENTKKIQDGIRADILKAVKEEHAKKVKKLKTDHDALILVKDEAFGRKLDIEQRKQAEQLQTRDDKIGSLETKLRESKLDAKQAERDLKSQHREELKKYKPEHSSAVKDQKSELKLKEAALERMTKEKDDLREEGLHYQKEWSIVQERNDQLQDMVRKNSKKVIELQEQVVELEKSATGSQEARDALKKDFDSVIKALNGESSRAVLGAYVREQEKSSQLAEAQRGISLLNQANDRNIMQARELRKRLATAESRLKRMEEKSRAPESDVQEVGDGHKTSDAANQSLKDGDTGMEDCHTDEMKPDAI